MRADAPALHWGGVFVDEMSAKISPACEYLAGKQPLSVATVSVLNVSVL